MKVPSKLILYINIHEAEVLDYPTTNLDLDDRNFVFTTHLTPDAEGVKGRLQAPCKSPWRTVMVCEKATDVLASRLILNLNEPCAIEDVSWIHPTKYMGVWWGDPQARQRRHRGEGRHRHHPLELAHLGARHRGRDRGQRHLLLAGHGPQPGRPMS